MSTAISNPRSLRYVVTELLWPKRRIWLLFHAVILVVGLDFWLTNYWYEGNVPLDVLVMYRPEGDTQYVGLVSTLARGIFGESVVFDSFRSGAQGFPLGSLAMHALCVAVFGSMGHAVADALAALLYYFSFAFFLTSIGVPIAFSRCISLITAAGVTKTIWLEFFVEKLQLPNLPLWFWGDRLPRPLVTETPLLLSIGLGFVLLRFSGARKSWKVWAAMGACLAWLLQGDLHGASIAGLFCATTGLTSLAVFGFSRPQLRNAGAACIAFVVGLLPFIVQQISLPADVSGRFGAFSVVRWPPPQEWEPMWLRFGQVVFVLLSSALVVRACRSRDDLLAPIPEERSWRRRALGWSPQILGLFALTVASLIALPAFCLVTGKAIQLYHFPDRWTRVTSYVFISAVALSVSACIGALRRGGLIGFIGGGAPRAGSALVAIGLSLVSLRAIADDAPVIKSANPRWGFAGNGNYRGDLIELDRELKKTRYQSAQVLGTLDHAVNLLWVTAHEGFSYVPDPFHTSRPDAELELRFASFCKMLHIGTPVYRALVRDWPAHTYWISGAKYSIHPLYQFSPLVDYTPAEQAKITTLPLTTGWLFMITQKEVTRLVQLYLDEKANKAPFRHPDLIVTNRFGLVASGRPDRTLYDETFANRHFRIWARKGL